MSQQLQPDGGQKHFAVGQGLLAAAETLNFSMNDQRSGLQMGGMPSGMGSSSSGIGGLEGSGQMPQHGGGSGGGGNTLGSTMKLFATLGLSAADLNALAKIPDEEISVETLPNILRRLKNRKGDTGERRPVPLMSSDAAYRGGRDGWGGMQMGKMGDQGSAYSSLPDSSSSRSYDMGYSGDSSNVGGSRERPYSELSSRDSFGLLGMAPSSSDFGQRRTGCPSTGNIQDFFGVTPTMFPHVCSICDFDIHSMMDWNTHTNGLRHAEHKRRLLNMYPDWEPSMSSGRGAGLLEAPNLPNLSPGILGPGPMAARGAGGAGGPSSSWGGGGMSNMPRPNQMENKVRSRVVVARFSQKILNNKALFAFAEQFGALRDHVVLKNKAFLELNSPQAAQDMVTYYNQHPAFLYGKPISFHLSNNLQFIEKEGRQSDMSMDNRDPGIQGSKVVFFSNLPREDDKKRELLTVARRFGVVEKYLFLSDQAFVQLGTPDDAEMMVKYYTVNPLTIRGRPIRLNVCAKYKTLNVNRRLGNSGGDGRNQRGGIGANASSSSRNSSNSRTAPRRSPSNSKTRDEDKRRKKSEEEKKASEKEKGGEDSGEGRKEDTDGEERVDEPTGSDSEEDEAKESSGDVRVKQDPDGKNDASDNEGESGAEQMAESEGQTETIKTEASADEYENREEATKEAAEGLDDDDAETMEQDMMENMEDFVTLDELADDEDEELRDGDGIDHTRKGGMRVVNIVGFRRGYNFRNELLGLAKPFGDVVKHLVLDLRPEAYVQFETEEEARAMAKFYSSNVTASVCGRPVRISHSMTYPTIRCGSSRVVYIGHLPPGKYPDEDVLQFAEPYGKISKYFLNWNKRECFIEMDDAESAEKMAETCKFDPPKLYGKRLTIYVSRKYRQLKHGHLRPQSLKRENSSSSTKSSKQADEPAAKKAKEETEEEEEKKEDVESGGGDEAAPDGSEEEPQEAKEVDDNGGDGGGQDIIPGILEEEEKSCEDQEETQEEEPAEQMESATNQEGQTEAPPTAGSKPSAASLPLPPFDPDTPIGAEHVKMGYYCRVCFLFYSNEDMAKKTHCSSEMHYEKLKKHLEKEQTKGEKKKSKKSAS